MPTTKIKWLEKKTFIGSGSNGHSIVLSGDNPNVGVRPAEMLLVSLGSCSAYDIIEIMAKKRQPLSHLEVTAMENVKTDLLRHSGQFMSNTL